MADSRGTVKAAVAGDIIGLYDKLWELPNRR